MTIVTSVVVCVIMYEFYKFFLDCVEIVYLCIFLSLSFHSPPLFVSSLWVPESGTAAFPWSSVPLAMYSGGDATWNLRLHLELAEVLPLPTHTPPRLLVATGLMQCVT